jgi:hypothetical protein
VPEDSEGEIGLARSDDAGALAAGVAIGAHAWALNRSEPEVRMAELK